MFWTAICNDDLDHLDLATGEINAADCATYDEMVECFAIGENDVAFAEEFIADSFNFDANADGLLTWHELNTALNANPTPVAPYIRTLF